MIKTTITYYPPLNELTIFNLDALTAGRKPPSKPITIAKIKQEIIILGFRANANDRSEKELKFNVEIVNNCKNDAKNKPTAAPINVINKDSLRNANKILLRLKPSERIVPISTVLLATAAYIVIAAPMIAPKLKIIVINVPRTRMNIARNSDCISKNLCSVITSNCCSLLSALNSL